MPRLRWAVLTFAAIGATGWAMGQNPVAPIPGGSQSPLMPGEIVGSGIPLNPVGKEIPKVGKRIGEPVNVPSDNPLLRRYDPNKPYDVFKGTNLDPKTIVTPMNGIPQVMGTDSSVLGQLYGKMKSFVGLSTKPTVSRIYTPGIARRTRERQEERMHRHD